jgi:hypothetical protein
MSHFRDGLRGYLDQRGYLNQKEGAVDGAGRLGRGNIQLV